MSDLNYFESHNTLDYIFNKKSEYSCAYKGHGVTVHPDVCLFVCLLDGASSHFQQYFSYMVAVSFSDGGKRSACRRSLTNVIT